MPQGLKGRPDDQALGRSRGGLSSKIHMAVRGLGCPVRVILTARHRGNASQAAACTRARPTNKLTRDTASTFRLGPEVPAVVEPRQRTMLRLRGAGDIAVRL